MYSCHARSKENEKICQAQVKKLAVHFCEYAHLFLYAFSLYFVLFSFFVFLCYKAMVFAAETQDPHSPVSLTIIPH